MLPAWKKTWPIVDPYIRNGMVYGIGTSSGSPSSFTTVVSSFRPDGGGLSMNTSAVAWIGAAARAALAEIDALATVVGVPVDTCDERRSTVTADQLLIEQRKRAPQRRRVVDKVAAAVILQTWLDGQHRARNA